MLREQCNTHIHIKLGGKSKDERVRINVLSQTIIKLWSKPQFQGKSIVKMKGSG